MGLPILYIAFEAKARDLIQRSAQGVVALALLTKEDEETLTLAEGTPNEYTYYSINDVDEKDWSKENMEQLRLTFMGNPKKVLVKRVDKEMTVQDITGYFGSKIWQYFSFPHATKEQNKEIATWIKAKRDVNHMPYKAVLGEEGADHEGIINLTTTDIFSNGKKHTAQEYTARIAGILAGLPSNQSSTYFTLKEVESIKELDSDTARNEAIDNGELIIINDGEKCKIARGVNSLKTVEKGKSDDFKKIRFIDIIDMIRMDLERTIRDNYVGKVQNSYNNQLLLIASIKRYFSILEDEEILNAEYNNTFGINLSEKKKYLKEQGVDVNSLTEAELLSYPTRDKVFLLGEIKTLDAMEDFYLTILV